MRISDWSSDVCSSDLAGLGQQGLGRLHTLLVGRVLPVHILRLAIVAGAWLHEAVGRKLAGAQHQIGSASCRGRVCQYVKISGDAGSLKKKQKKPQNRKPLPDTNNTRNSMTSQD